MKDPRFDALPSDTPKRIDRLTRDLAWGVLNEKWDNAFYIQGIPAWGDLEFATRWNRDTLMSYLSEVWDNKPPNPARLVDLGYIIEGDGVGNDIARYRLTEKGLRLAQNPQPGPIFISYRRSESTAFAILLSDRLKANGLVPFLDKQPDRENQGLAVKPGDNWPTVLKAEIEVRDHFVILIAPTTLSSEIVCQEMEYALASGKNIIPIWHRGFDPKNKDHFPEALFLSIQKAITETDAILVPVEDPRQYESAIERFLELFGIQS